MNQSNNTRLFLMVIFPLFSLIPCFLFLFVDFRRSFVSMQVSSAHFLYVFCFVMIGVTKQLGYLFKFAMTSFASAIYAEMMDMLRSAATRRKREKGMSSVGEARRDRRIDVQALHCQASTHSY